jgi:hypothetical protein
VAKNVMAANLYRLLKFLILIRFLPLGRPANSGLDPRCWRLQLLCPRFLLLMAAFLSVDCGYFYYMWVEQATSLTPSVARITGLVFKLAMMTLPTVFPLTLGVTACKLGSSAFRLPDAGLHHRLAWSRVLFLIGVDVLFVLGLIGIHLPQLMRGNSQLLGAFCVSSLGAVGLFCLAAHDLCISVWLEDYWQVELTD